MMREDSVAREERSLDVDELENSPMNTSAPSTRARFDDCDLARRRTGAERVSEMESVAIQDRWPTTMVEQNLGRYSVGIGIVEHTMSLMLK